MKMYDVGTDSDFIDLSFMKTEHDGKTGYIMSLGFLAVDENDDLDFDDMTFLTADGMYDSIESGIMAIAAMDHFGIISIDKFVMDYHVYDAEGKLIDGETGSVQKMLALMQSHVEDDGVPGAQID